ncbi:ATP-binding protein [Deltaproteobacteria bacterium TL4]
MPVGSHKDTFKAHQLTKKIAGKGNEHTLANLAANILMDFVKNHRQVNSENVIEQLPEDSSQYEMPELDKALKAVGGLCGQCEESHNDSCFVNQARRALIVAKTGADVGTKFDGNSTLEDLIKKAENMVVKQKPQAKENGQADGDPKTEVSKVEIVAGAEQIAEKLPPSQNLAELAIDAIRKLEKEYENLRTQNVSWTKKREQECETLKEKDIFRGALIDEIVDTISAVSEGNFAAEMPEHEDEQLGKLAKAFNLMLKTINETMSNLDKLVAERSAEMRMIMNTVPVGLLSVNQDLRINPEYSSACEKILGLKELRGRDFLDTLGITKRRGEDRNKMVEFLDIFRQLLLPEDDMQMMNPFAELQLNNERGTWLHLEYHVIERKDKTNDILVVMEDITSAKEMEAEMALSVGENHFLKAIAEDADLFCEFLVEGKKTLLNAKTLVNKMVTLEDPRPAVNELFRGVHTIKGTAGAFNLDSIASLAAELENSLSDLRESTEIAAEVMEETEAALVKLTGEMSEVAEKTEKLLGHILDESGDLQLRISSSEIKQQMYDISTMFIPDEPKKEIVSRLRTLRQLDVNKALARSIKIVPGLIERLEKDISFTVEDKTRIDCDVANELNTPLVHLIRNSFDHGIEPWEERKAQGKPEQGQVKLTVSSDDQFLNISISDDGRGLDAEKLKEVALRKGLISVEEARALTEKESQELIFRPGFSTAESVTSVSGRGVGMDAVLTTIRDSLKGKIYIDSTLHKGTTFTVKIPLE